MFLLLPRSMIRKRYARPITVALTAYSLLLLSTLIGCGTSPSTIGEQTQDGGPKQTGAVYGRVQHEAGALGRRTSIGTVRIEYHNEWTGEGLSHTTEEDGTFLWSLPEGRYEITSLRVGARSLRFPEGHGIRFRVVSGKTVYLGSLTFLPPASHRSGGLDILDDYAMETHRLTEHYPVLEKKPPLKGLMFRLPAGEHGRMFIDVVINDKVLVPFLLDTGASLTIITRATALSLGLDDWESLDWMTFTTSGGPVRSPVIELDSIRVGEHALEDVEVAIDVEEHLPFGLLGMNFLRHFRVVVDHQRQQVQLLR